jgi:hypothetical protein
MTRPQTIDFSKKILHGASLLGMALATLFFSIRTLAQLFMTLHAAVVERVHAVRDEGFKFDIFVAGRTLHVKRLEIDVAVTAESLKIGNSFRCCPVMADKTVYDIVEFCTVCLDEFFVHSDAVTGTAFGVGPCVMAGLTLDTVVPGMTLVFEHHEPAGVGQCDTHGFLRSI